MTNMKTYTVSRRFIVEVSRDVVAESFAAADAKAEAKFERFLKVLPAVSLNDWSPIDGGFISMEQQD